MRHADHFAIRFRIKGIPVFGIQSPLLERPGLIRQLISDNNPLPAGHAVNGRVGLDVPIRRVNSLPDTLQIRMPVTRPGRRIVLCGADHWL